MSLAVENLSKHFGGVHAVAPLTTSFGPGITAVIGPNGAGKTTFFNLLAGVYQPSTGTIRHRGDDITRLPVADRARRGIQRTFQNLQIFFSMTALENVMVGASGRLRMGVVPSLVNWPSIARQTRQTRQRAEQLMVEVGLGDYLGSSADAMPYGALKRLEIARALAADPEILMLDEPAAGLNPRETAEIDELIRRIANRGIMVLLVEHDMPLVMAVSDRIIVLDHGRQLADGLPQQVRENPEVIAAYLGQECD